MIKKNALLLLAAVVLLSGCTHPATTGRASSDDTIRLTEERLGRPLIAAEATAPAITAAERTRLVSAYWQTANTGLVDRPLPAVLARDVSPARRQILIDLDGGQCVLCGSTIGLQVDHRIALQNGGDNSPGNLATLCGKCHKEKNKLDNCLRRKREKITGADPHGDVCQ